MTCHHGIVGPWDGKGAVYPGLIFRGELNRSSKGDGPRIVSWQTRRLGCDVSADGSRLPVSRAFIVQ